ncbi:hypothetical protein H4R19_006675 [Coemansia spiralis]|nr:hypothetical protein H4R19_006675 [Coemansia spiralis]
MANDYTCTPHGECIPCTAAEGAADYCRANGYKQAADCQWNAGMPKERQGELPQFVECAGVGDLERRAFFRNHLLFIVLGLAAFGLYVWRRRRIFGHSPA